MQALVISITYPDFACPFKKIFLPGFCLKYESLCRFTGEWLPDADGGMRVRNAVRSCVPTGEGGGLKPHAPEKRGDGAPQEREGEGQTLNP